jgi:chromosome segregation ATPase
MQERGPDGGFDPVIKLLTDLIARLEEEASAETSQHEWCETEKTTSVTAKEEREGSIVSLKAKINEDTTLSATLKTEILFLESEIARVEKETADAKVLRKEQHDAYVKAKADHEEVIKAIGLALEALSGQYGGAAFIQVNAAQGQAQNQAANQAPGQAGVFQDYKSGSSGAGSAIEMLNDLQSRYASALQEIEQTEVDQQKAHDELVATNEQFIADTTNTRNMKLKERRAKLGQLGDAKTEMKTNLLELHEVNKYLQNLRPSCDDIRSTYEERKKRREAEIAALKEALEVISDPSMMGAAQ